MQERKSIRNASEGIPQSTCLVVSLIVLLTFVLGLLWSHYKLFWVDELLAYYSDAKPGFRQILYDQTYLPFTTDPPLFTLISHFFLGLFPSSPEFATRLPSLLALNVTQVCAFLLTLRLTGKRAIALLALVLPLFLVTFDYGPEARPYSFYAASFALGLVAYQSAVAPENTRRALALFGIFAGFGLGILTHYFGVFLPLTVLLAEWERARERRRMDWGILCAVVAAYLLAATYLPAMHTLHEIQAHYYDMGTFRWRMIVITYMFFVGHFGIYQFIVYGKAAHVAALLGTVIGIPFFAICLYRRSRTEWRSPGQRPVFMALFAAFFLPFLNVAVSHYVTHAYQPRYSLPACVAISALFPLLLEPWLSARRAHVLLVVLSVASTIYAARHCVMAYRAAQVELAQLNDVALLKQLSGAEADPHVYIQGSTEFLPAMFYGPPLLKSTAMGFYSREHELLWLGRDTAAIYMRNLGLAAKLPVTSYQAIESAQGPHLFLLYDDALEEWDGMEFASGRVRAEVVGRAAGGKVVRVIFP